MNWGELKREVKNLGFEETESLEEYSEHIVDATNRALKTISFTAPLISRYDFSQDGTESGLKRYDIVSLTSENGKRRFFAFADAPVRVYRGFYETFNDFEIEQGREIVMDASCEGDFSVFYKRIPERISDGADDNTEIDVDPLMEIALPLLVAYYVWLDDDERKATAYYNQYEAVKNEVLGQVNIPRAKIVGGF